MCIVIHRHPSSSIVIKEGTAITVRERVIHSFTVPFDCHTIHFVPPFSKNHCVTIRFSHPVPNGFPE